MLLVAGGHWLCAELLRQPRLAVVGEEVAPVRLIVGSQQDLFDDQIAAIEKISLPQPVPPRVSTGLVDEMVRQLRSQFQLKTQFYLDRVKEKEATQQALIDERRLDRLERRREEIRDEMEQKRQALRQSWEKNLEEKKKEIQRHFRAKRLEVEVRLKTLTASEEQKKEWMEELAKINQGEEEAWRELVRDEEEAWRKTLEDLEKETQDRMRMAELDEKTRAQLELEKERRSLSEQLEAWVDAGKRNMAKQEAALRRAMPMWQLSQLPKKTAYDKADHLRRLKAKRAFWRRVETEELPLLEALAQLHDLKLVLAKPVYADATLLLDRRWIGLMR